MSQRGLKTNEGSNTKYLAMSNGMFVQRVGKPMDFEEHEKQKENMPPNVFVRQLEKGANKGKFVHEKRFDQFTGQLISIQKESHDQYGDSRAFKIDVTVDEPEFLILKLPYSSGYSGNILMRLPNIKSFENDLTFNGYNFTPKDSSKPRMGIWIAENIGDNAPKVSPFYTRETTNGLPDMEEMTDPKTGKPVWSSIKRFQFLEKMVAETILPKLKVSTSAVSPVDEPGDDIPQSEFENVGDNEELPF